jgi:putative GTP pyrophosphokinase
MTTAAGLPASRRQINRAGERMRDWWNDRSMPSGALATDSDLRAALHLVTDYRRGFQVPLNRVTMTVRSFVTSEHLPVVVSQRLKRVPTIVYKLARYPNMDLTRMQDIGGCRAIVPDRSAQILVLRRIRRVCEVMRVNDYVENPKATGYRAVHAVVSRQGRPIEIQLRTPLQQQWAATADSIAGRLDLYELYDGEGPAELLRWLVLLAELVAARELGEAADQAVVEEFVALREQVRHYTVAP